MTQGNHSYRMREYNAAAVFGIIFRFKKKKLQKTKTKSQPGLQNVKMRFNAIARGLLKCTVNKTTDLCWKTNVFMCEKLMTNDR